MKQIDVDIDVFAAIWQRRESGENSENAILRRILITDHNTEMQTTRSMLSSEVKTSPIELGSALYEDMKMGKIRWVDDIRAVLVAMGGRASLDNIYRAVEARRSVGGRSVPRTLDAVVRRTLEDHSSDSANFRGADLFRLVGRGEWAIR